MSGWQLTCFRTTLAKEQTLITGILTITKQQIANIKEKRTSLQRRERTTIHIIIIKNY